MPFLWIAGVAWALSKPIPTAVVLDDDTPAEAPGPETEAGGQPAEVVGEAARAAASESAVALPSVADEAGDHLSHLKTSERAPVRRKALDLGARPSEDARAVPSRRVRWIGPLGATGIGVAVIGIGSVALGTVFINKGTIVEPSDEQLKVIKDYGHPGWVLYGAGMGVTAIGAIAIAIDVTAGRERRFRRVLLRPRIGLTHAGLQLRGWF